MVFAYLPLLRVLRLPRRRSVENLPDFLDEILGQARLGDERVAAGLLRALRNAGQRMAGQRDDRDRRRALVGLEPPRRLPAVHDRQRQIHQDDVGRCLDGALQRLHAVGRLDDVEAGELEVFAVHLARVRIVVDERARAGGRPCFRSSPSLRWQCQRERRALADLALQR